MKGLDTFASEQISHGEPEVDNGNQLEGFRIIQKRKEGGLHQSGDSEGVKKYANSNFFFFSLTLFLFSQVLREDRAVTLPERGGVLTMHEMVSWPSK